MLRYPLVAWSLLACFLAPVALHAEGLVPFAVGGPSVGLPSLPVGGAADGMPSGTGGTGSSRAYVGWIADRNGSTWAIQRVASKGTGQWSLGGLWVEAAQDFAFSEQFGLAITGGLLVPSKAQGTWVRDTTEEAVGFRVPSYDWWYGEGLAKIRVSGQLEFLAGCRWDHTSTRLEYTDKTCDDYILNVQVPFVGLQLCQSLSPGSLLLRVTGSPYVGGRLRYHYWTNTAYVEFADFRVSGSSDFVELLADYRVPLTEDLSIGGYVKWYGLRVRTSETSLSGSTAEPISWAVDIRTLTVGGSLSMSFASPW